MKDNDQILRIFAELGKRNVKKKRALLRQLKVSSEQQVTLKDLHQLVRSEQGSAECKEIACWIIGEVGNKKSIEFLLEAFSSQDKNLSHMAMLSLSRIRSERALQFMIKALRTSPDDMQRRNAAYVIQSYFGDERAVSALIDTLNDKTQSPETRAQAAEGLGTLTATSATETLLANVHDSALVVRLECIYALGQVGMDAAIISELEKLLNDESSVYGEKVKDKASESIGYIMRRVKALEKCNGDRATVDVWTLNALADEMEQSSQ